MKAGHELDALIAEKVMGWTVNEHGYWASKVEPKVCYNVNEEDYAISDDAPPWAPSTDMTCAWEVVEKLDLPPEWYDEDHPEITPRLKINAVIRLEDGRWMARIDAPCGLNEGYYERNCYESGEKEFAIGDTAPHAICLAAPKAVGVKL